MRKALPQKGAAWDILERHMDEMTAGDVDWRNGRVPLYVFFATKSVHEIGRKAFLKFMSENALGGKRAFFGIGRMEEEIVQMGLSLLSAPGGAAGAMTTGGTESIVLAVKGARDWFRAQHRQAGPLNIVVPHSAHPAFDKAAALMDIDVRRTPLREDLRADPTEIQSAIDRSTMMIVGSAPCFPHGVIDPIGALGTVAEQAGVWLHVDACVGGYLAPFARMVGKPIPPFDFSIPEVRSISADLHKFGFCPKPASTVFYRLADDLERQTFDLDVWPSGRFATRTLVGTRAAGGVAAAWAVMNHLGVEGYCDIARRLLAMTHAYVEAIEETEGLYCLTKPDLSIVNFGGRDVDIFAVAEEMTKASWLVGLTNAPRGVHLMMSLLHEPARKAYIADLRTAVAAVRKERKPADSKTQATY